MLRSCLNSVGRLIRNTSLRQTNNTLQYNKHILALQHPITFRSTFSSLFRYNVPQHSNISLLQPKGLELLQPSRSLTKYSIQSGKRKTVKAVLKRFYRLDWGMWIRGRCGRNKKLYSKSANRKRRLRQHVFTNATQSWLLDCMVTKYWRKPKYYVDDPYQPYHQRENFTLTRRKPFVPNQS